MPWTIKDYELVLQEQRFGDDGARTTWPDQADDRYNQMGEKYDEITHC